MSFKLIGKKLFRSSIFLKVSKESSARPLMFLLLAACHSLCCSHGSMGFNPIDFGPISFQLIHTLFENLKHLVIFWLWRTSWRCFRLKYCILRNISIRVHIEIDVGIVIVNLECRFSLVQSFLITFDQLFVSLDLHAMVLYNDILYFLFGEHMWVFKNLLQEIVNFTPIFGPTKNFIRIFTLWWTRVSH